MLDLVEGGGSLCLLIGVGHDYTGADAVGKRRLEHSTGLLLVVLVLMGRLLRLRLLMMTMMHVRRCHAHRHGLPG